MKPLKIAFLWHNHQPNYEYKGYYFLPWVRLHAIKDYFDFPSLLYQFPNVKMNFNFVPSLFEQIDSIVNEEILDEVYILSRKNTIELGEDDKSNILKKFFVTNYQNLIAPYDRYRELFDLNKNSDDLKKFTTQDYLDLQVWYNLTWMGFYSRKNVFIKRLFDKGKDFTENEKNLLLDFQIDVLKNIKSNLSNLIKLGQLELSFSPYNHPILPLLINPFEGMSVSEVNSMNKDFDFKNYLDADSQIKLSKEYYKNNFEVKLKGMWPSEGSLSNETLELLINNDFTWTATDEKILTNSINENDNLAKYFPRKFIGKNGEITIYFRDTYLSDRIGFLYSSMDADQAINDFFYHLNQIRNSIIEKYGEEGLESACVSIILDGENCWEYYKNMGFEFREKLFKALNHDNYFETILMSNTNNNFHLPLNSIEPGSWINGNFDIWMGEPKHKLAWELLNKTIKLIKNNSSEFEKVKLDLAMKYIYRAQSSDWFWWYYSSHNAPNKTDFDVLFRENLIMALKSLNLEIPNELLIPIWTEEDFEEMKKIGINRNSTMHQVIS